jgi:hypothetical protein
MQLRRREGQDRSAPMSLGKRCVVQGLKRVHVGPRKDGARKDERIRRDFFCEQRPAGNGASCQLDDFGGRCTRPGVVIGQQRQQHPSTFGRVVGVFTNPLQPLTGLVVDAGFEEAALD